MILPADPEGSTRLVCRVTIEFRDAVDHAALVAGLDRSKFMREALEAAVLREEAEEARRLGVTRARRLGGRRTSIPGLCIHPLTGRETRGLSIWCRVCDTEIRRIG